MKINVTAIIDIVFLLIVFFLVVCQFIEAENFPVQVPDSCEYAEDAGEATEAFTTITVMHKAGGRTGFAVNSQQVVGSAGKELTGRITKLINNRVEDLPEQRRVVTVRVDTDVPYSEAQYALAAVARSKATNIQLAVLKHRRNGD